VKTSALKKRRGHPPVSPGPLMKTGLPRERRKIPNSKKKKKKREKKEKKNKKQNRYGLLNPQ